MNTASRTTRSLKRRVTAGIGALILAGTPLQAKNVAAFVAPEGGHTTFVTENGFVNMFLDQTGFQDPSCTRYFKKEAYANSVAIHTTSSSDDDLYIFKSSYELFDSNPKGDGTIDRISAVITAIATTPPFEEREFWISGTVTNGQYLVNEASVEGYMPQGATAVEAAHSGEVLSRLAQYIQYNIPIFNAGMDGLVMGKELPPLSARQTLIARSSQTTPSLLQEKDYRVFPLPTLFFEQLQSYEKNSQQQCMK